MRRVVPLLASVSLTACAGVEPFQMRLEAQIALEKPVLVAPVIQPTNDPPVSP